MKKIQFLLAFLFIGFIILMFIKQSAREEKLFKEIVYGKVISSEKSNKGYYNMTINQNGKLRALGYIPGNHKLMAIPGDSVYKNRNSDVFFIRKNEMPNFIKTDWKDCHINGQWDD
ncbi:MAG: hypothetical protein ABL876_09430 [Chitinophagaceae bacterium]